MALLPERPCSLRPRSWAFARAVVLEVIPEGFGTGHDYLQHHRDDARHPPDYPKEMLERHATTQAPAGVGFLVAIFYLFVGLNLLRKAHVWARQSGPVQKLVAHARGRAYGFLAAVLCQLGIAIALLFAK